MGEGLSVDCVMKSAFDTEKREKGKVSFGEKLVGLHSIISDMYRADINGNWMRQKFKYLSEHTEEMGYYDYDMSVKGSVEEHMADLLIGICALAREKDVDLQNYVKAKLKEREKRIKKEGKKK